MPTPTLSFTFTTINAPGAVDAINNRGEVVENY
jgi:hypothetical protein